MKSTDALLAELGRPDGPRRAVIRTLPGAGIRAILEEFIGRTSEKGLALILVPSVVLAEQWAFRLDRREVEVQVLRSSADALQLRSLEPEVRPRGVIVATFARARHGQARMALATHRFDLLVYDGVAAGSPGASFRDDFVTASKEVALVTGTAPFDWPGSETLFEVTERDFDEATGSVALTSIHYDASVKDAEALDAARLFVARFNGPDLDDSEPASRASVHEELLKVASGAMTPRRPTAQEQEQAWRLVDRLEGAVDADPRLDALDHLLRERSDVSKWIISVLRRADAYYILDHLRAQRIDAAVLTGDFPLTARLEVLTSGVQVIVVTTAVITSMSQWPSGYAAVWWNPPRTRSDYEGRMSLLATAKGATVFQLFAQ